MLLRCSVLGVKRREQLCLQQTKPRMSVDSLELWRQGDLTVFAISMDLTFTFLRTHGLNEQSKIPTHRLENEP